MSNGPHISPGGKSKRPALSEDLLLQYLEGNLPAGRQHEVELWLADEGMESDAIEGLRSLHAADTKHSVGRINHGLRKMLLHRRKKRRPLKSDHMAWVAIAIVLLLAIVAYIVIRKAI